MISIEQARRFFADEVRLAAGLRNPAIWRAFATVPRERFLGSGPWRIALPDLGLGPTYTGTEDDNPCWLYHNVSFALDQSRHLLSGQPSTVARWIDDLNVNLNERVWHLGSGAGYYTAILAELAGPDGAVLATEADRELAARARENLAPYSWVTVQEGAGFPECSECADAILMSAGVTHLEPAWLDNLRDGGRLLAPLTVSIGPTQGKGVMLKVTRTGMDFSAQVVTFAVGYSAVGLRDPSLEPILGKAMSTGTILRVRAVRRDLHSPGETCVLHREGACLSLGAKP